MTDIDPGSGLGERGHYWDGIYRDKEPTEVGWYQPQPAVSLELIESLGLAHDAPIIDVGAGASNLVDALLDRGFTDISLLDVSTVALDLVRQRLTGTTNVEYLHADVLSWRPTRRYALWHDRAVFHFLVDAADRSRYLDTMRAALAFDGLAIIATFGQDGPERCSGLPVARYSAEALIDLLGSDFVITATRAQRHVTPAGHPQPFTWVAARREPIA